MYRETPINGTLLQLFYFEKKNKEGLLLYFS